MKKRKKPTQIVEGWTEFIQTYPVYDPVVAELVGADYEIEHAEFETGKQTMWQNNRYVVIKKELDTGMTWLSIRHRNRKAIRDWRHFQRIKNELTSPEREGVEIYPSESRLVDEANQYHIWVLPEGDKISFGFPERMVSDDEVLGAGKQRKFKKSA